jgi:hypothetical protein
VTSFPAAALFDGFKVTHFSYGTTSGSCRNVPRKASKGFGVPSTRVDSQGFLVSVQKFDRIFDSDNVFGSVELIQSMMSMRLWIFRFQWFR